MLNDEVRARLFSPRLKRELQGYRAKEELARHFAAAPTDDALSRVLYADIKTYLPGDILTKVDRASMASSLEVRAPFLDHRFAEWSARLPADLKLRNGEGKHVLKGALGALLPREILYRAKQGFSVPLAHGSAARCATARAPISRDRCCARPLVRRCLYCRRDRSAWQRPARP